MSETVRIPGEETFPGGRNKKQKVLFALKKQQITFF